MFYLEENANIDPDLKILKKEEYANYLGVKEIFERARVEAAQIVEDAKQAYEDEKKRGFQEGMDEGNKKITEHMIKTIDQSVKNFESFENDIIDVVIKALRKILGEMNDKDLTTRVVKNALESVRSQKRVTLLVAPSDVEGLKENLDKIMADFPTITYFDVESDGRIKPGGCMLQTDMGVVDATIDVQLTAIRESLTRVIK